MKNSGFSLVELLVAIGIIAILVTVGVVAGGKMYRYMNEKKTASYMEIIKNSIMAFQEDTGDYPDIADTDKATYEECGKDDYSDETLEYKLIDNDFSKERLKDLPDEAFDDDFDTRTSDGKVRGGFVDAWGNRFYYSPEGGIGGSPVLLSAGPDGKIVFDSGAIKDGAPENDDNISSEK